MLFQVYVKNSTTNITTTKMTSDLSQDQNGENRYKLTEKAYKRSYLDEYRFDIDHCTISFLKCLFNFFNVRFKHFYFL